MWANHDTSKLFLPPYSDQSRKLFRLFHCVLVHLATTQSGLCCVFAEKPVSDRSTTGSIRHTSPSRVRTTPSAAKPQSIAYTSITYGNRFWAPPPYTRHAFKGPYSRPRIQMASTNKSNTRTPPTISITQLPSTAEMRRALSRRERSVEKPLPILHRNNSTGHVKDFPSPPGGGLKRNMSRRDKFVKAITNPDTIFRHDPDSPPPESKYVALNFERVKHS